jgi:hypothetical protein
MFQFAAHSLAIATLFAIWSSAFANPNITCHNEHPAPPPGLEDCTSVDLRPFLGRPRDQGPTGWCFAHTTADLATVELLTRVSAFDVAAQYILHSQENLERLQSADIKSFLMHYKSVTGYVPDSHTLPPGDFYADWTFYRTEDKQSYNPQHFLSDMGIYNIGGSEQVALITAQVRDFCEDPPPKNDDGTEYFKVLMNQAKALYAGEVYNPAWLTKAKRPTADMSLYNSGAVYSSERLQGQAYAFAAVDWLACGSPGDPDSKRIRQDQALIPETDTAAASLKELQKTCERSEKCRIDIRDHMFANIDRALNSCRAVSIGYAYNDLANSDSETMKYIREMEYDMAESSNDHASIIAARKVINGECRYFVRNSFGADCSIYRREFMKQNLCEESEGGVWIRKSDLKSLYSTIMVRGGNTGPAAQR